jgi:hypothetical protein
VCTLTFAWGAFAGTPLVVAANRDERDDRPSSPPERLDAEPAVVAPVDERAGGTWIGYNEYGLFAGITNRWTADEREGERSRGQLMRDVLAHRTAGAAARHVEREVEERVYEGFNLVVVDGFAGLDDVPAGFGGPPPADRDDPASAVLIEYDGAVRSRALEPGVHVVVNVGADGTYAVPEGSRYEEPAREQAADADRLLRELTPEPGETAPAWRDRAAETIRDHDYGVCVHRDGFGTQSSSLLAFGEGGVRYQFADGPPCENEYRDVDAAL